MVKGFYYTMMDFGPSYSNTPVSDTGTFLRLISKSFLRKDTDKPFLHAKFQTNLFVRKCSKYEEFKIISDSAV